MAADVKQMYHMIRLPDCDKPSTRFLWGESAEEEPSVYQFERTVIVWRSFNATQGEIHNKARCR